MSIPYKVNVTIEKDEYGYYACCPELEGCQTQSDSLEEVLNNIREAIELYLETLSKNCKRKKLGNPRKDFSLSVSITPINQKIEDQIDLSGIKRKNVPRVWRIPGTIIKKQSEEV